MNSCRPEAKTCDLLKKKNIFSFRLSPDCFLSTTTNKKTNVWFGYGKLAFARHKNAAFAK
jgi:hypothetical protein